MRDEMSQLKNKGLKSQIQKNRGQNLHFNHIYIYIYIYICIYVCITNSKQFKFKNEKIINNKPVGSI